MLKISKLLNIANENAHLAVESLETVLAQIPNASLSFEFENRPNKEIDFVVSIKTDQLTQTLGCVVKSRAWSTDIHGIMRTGAQHIATSNGGPVALVLIVPYISEITAEVCAQQGLSWADFAGNCELRLTNSYIRIRGNPNKYAKSRGTASLYTPKASRVLHALLLDPSQKWQTESLSKASGVSLGQVANVKKRLILNNWVRASYGEIALIEPLKLLKDWKENYQPKRRPIRYFTLDSPKQFESRVATELANYAFTEFSAAEKYAPYTRHQQMSFYVPRWDESLVKVLGLRSGDGSSNVTIYESEDYELLTEEINGFRCVSPVLTYLDLGLISNRGADAAEHLLETAIIPRWK